MGKKETHVFQTEVKQLLQLMIHALYSNKEIFLRELISNSSDALDKLRFEAISDDTLNEGESELVIQVEFDAEAKTVTIRDNGIGMTRDEVIENIGTIANSGTKRFLDKLTGDQAKDSHLIGQFGVGFYSAFIVADKVSLHTRKAGLKAEDAVLWESSGEGEFSLESVEKQTKGTEITLHLKDDMDEFLNELRLKNIITTYSDHINFPIQMKKAVEEGDDDLEKKLEVEWQQVNKATAIWSQPKSELSDEDYDSFYQALSHDFEKPLAVMHNQVEGTLEYTSLLYVPKKAPFDLYDRDRRYGLKLYVKRVFIMDDAEHLMPAYLRFVRGVIDSNDLPLNVSREILQSNQVVDRIRSASVRRVLDQLAKLAKAEDQTDYQTFWSAFGQVLKEGIVEDYANHEKIAKLLRFATTHDSSKEQTVSLEDYVSRMQDDQDSIYYILADNHMAALGSPHLEVFRKKGIEVILLSDRIDQWLVSHLTEFAGKTFKSITQGDIKELADDEDLSDEEKQTRENLTEKVKKALDDQVSDVKMTVRLIDSPACVVTGEGEISSHMARLMEQMGQELPKSKPILELNPNHALVKQLENEEDEALIKDWSLFLFEQAQLAEGDQLEAPADFVKRINRLLTAV